MKKDESGVKFAAEKLALARAKAQGHWKLLAACLLALAVVVMILLLRSANSRRDALQQQLDQQQEQLERQNQLIEALRGKDPTQNSNETAPVVTSETIEEQLGAIKELVTEEYIYTNADKKESSETWLWGVERPFSGKSILITYDGSIKAGIDLSQAEIDVDEEKKTVTVTLPPSKITDNNIPQDSIVIVEVKNGLFNDVTFDNYNDFVVEQKIIMERKAIDQGLLTKADESAKALVKSILSVLPGMDAYTLTIRQQAG